MKKLLTLLLCLTLLFAFTCPVAATDIPMSFTNMVVDNADLLSDAEELELIERAWELTMDYECAVYIVTVESLEGYSAWEYNEAIHSQYNMGYGEDQSCIILLLSTEYRDYDIMAHGYGNYAFTDYGKDVMAESFLNDFAENDWYAGFNVYLDHCEKYLQHAQMGEPFDVDGDKSPVLGVVIAAAVSSLIAFIVCSIFKAQMQTAKKQTYATNYITAEGLSLTNRSDLFTHTTRTRRYIEPKSSSSGGTTVNRNGSSHKSGKF